jgi:aspartate-semialdehyde dehydrogenase
MTARIPVTVLGATGVVGQRFVRRLAAHPRFEIRHLAASERSTGKRYAEACDWRLGGEPYAGLADRVLVPCEARAALAPVVFSALDASVAREIEPELAEAGAWVFSNASAFRMEADVPLLVPEVNLPHLELVAAQRRARGWSGAIVCNPNCTATVLVSALAPLHVVFGVEAAIMTSMQAVSGAGYPGVPTLDILGNVVPYIRSEEEKVEEETRKMLGKFVAGSRGGEITHAPAAVSALCHRVPVIDGHTEAVSVRLAGQPSVEEVRAVLAGWDPLPRELDLPTAPHPPIVLHDRPERPQPRLDLPERGTPSDGMTVHVGRVRPCGVLGVKLTILGHNAERGAAGASLLNAELALATGWLDSSRVR